ncbi:MAG: hypothetical protein EBW96_00505 [Actinobacteria bacterium]|nr:hypothetical protein [Actinomycetota bacterium]
MSRDAQRPSVCAKSVLVAQGVASPDVATMPKAAQPASFWKSSEAERLWVLAWFIALCVAAIRFTSISGERTFQYDEWNFVMNRWQWSADTFLAPHNSHFSVFPATMFFLLFRIVGLEQYGVYQAVGYLAHFSVATLLLVALRRRLGDIGALAIAVSVLFLGTGAENSLWPFQIGSMGSVAGYLIAIVAIESDRPSAPRAVLIGLVLSLGSAGFGVVAVFGVVAETLLRRQVRRYWWSIAIPVGVWAAWYVLWGTSEMVGSNLTKAPTYVHESLAAAVAATFRSPLAWGFVFSWLLVVVVVRRVIVSRGHEARLIALSAVLLAFWGLTAMSRAQYWAPGSNRYVYVAVPLLWLVVAEVVRGLQRQVLIATSCVLAAWSLSATWDAMSAHARWLREWSEAVSAELWVVESRLDIAAKNYRPDPVRAPDIEAAKFGRAIVALESSPAMAVERIATTSSTTRAEVDRVLYELGAAVLSTSESSGLCVAGSETEQEIALQAGSQSILITTGTSEVGLRAFGDNVIDATRVQASGERNLVVTIDQRNPAEQWRLVLLTPGARACVVG